MHDGARPGADYHLVRGFWPRPLRPRRALTALSFFIFVGDLVFDIVSGVMCFKHVAYKLFALSPSSLRDAREQFLPAPVTLGVVEPGADTLRPGRRTHTVYFSYFRATAHLLLSRRVFSACYIRTLHP
jgi:hypothetical protein